MKSSKQYVTTLLTANLLKIKDGKSDMCTFWEGFSLVLTRPFLLQPCFFEDMYLSLGSTYSSGVVYPTSMSPRTWKTGAKHCARLKEGVLAATSGVVAVRIPKKSMYIDLYLVDFHGKFRCINIPYMDLMTSDSLRKQQVRSGIWWKKSCSICVMKPSAKVGTNILINWLAKFLPWTGSLTQSSQNTLQ